jgi:hypothetical protein
MLNAPVIVQDGEEIQVGDGIASVEPSDLTYGSDSFGNPIKTATLIAEAEAINPCLDVGADKLALHRRLLRDLSCPPEPSPSTPKSGNPRS